MKTLQKLGGFAALYLAAGYLVGMVGFLAVVDVSGIVDPVQKVALMAENLSFLYVLYLFVYVIWGFFMVLLALALYERLKAGSPAIMQIATVFGIFCGCVIIISGMIHNAGMQTVVDLYGKNQAQAGTIWLTIDSVCGWLTETEPNKTPVLNKCRLRKGVLERVTPTEPILHTLIRCLPVMMVISVLTASFIDVRQTFPRQIPMSRYYCLPVHNPVQ